MTWTTWLPGKARLLLARHPKRETEDRAAVLARLDPDAPAMGLDDGAADRQSQPHALFLGRDEGLEEMGRHFRRQPQAGIGNADLRHGRIARGRGDLQFAPSRRLG